LASLVLFLFWCLLNVLLAFRIALFTVKGVNREQVVFGILILSAFVLMFVASYAVFYRYVHVQIRHVWTLWPVTLLAPCFLFKGVRRLKHLNRDRILSMIFAGIMAVLVLVNVLVVHRFTLMHQPVQNVSQPDLDYFVFLDNFAQNRYQAAAYLDSGGAADMEAYRHFAENKDWENALYHARQAVLKGSHEGESRLMCVIALRKLGRPEEALEVLNQTKTRTHETQFLEIQLLLDLERTAEAQKKINRFLPEAPPDLRKHLELMTRKRANPRPTDSRGLRGLDEN
jgi:hypothetical protein